MASTDRGYTSSVLWEQQFIKDVMKHNCQKKSKKDLWPECGYVTKVHTDEVHHKEKETIIT